MKFVILFSLCFITSLYAREIEIMSYNVENLFDTVHDEGKDDWSYLPKNAVGKSDACAKEDEKYIKSCLESDWTAEKLELKLENLAHVIKASRGGKLPDILTVAEIENLNVAKMLAAKLGFKFVYTTNGPDQRGIDLAIMFNETDDLKIKEVKEHEVKGHKYFKEKPTRPILEAKFKVDDKYDLYVFVNHWPSQANPSEVRIKAADTLVDLAKRRTFLKKKKAFVVALGDFNVLPTDYPHAFHVEVLKEFKDLHETFMSDKTTTTDQKKMFPMGSYFYAPKMSWDLLDRVFFTDNMLNEDSPLKMDVQSYKIHSDSSFTQAYKFNSPGYYQGTVMAGAPIRFRESGKTAEEIGFSDHLPVYFKIQLK